MKPPYTIRCGENTENEFGIPVFVGKTVYIYTKTSPFVEIWKQIFLPMRKWVEMFGFVGLYFVILGGYLSPRNSDQFIDCSMLRYVLCLFLCMSSLFRSVL